MESIPDNKNTNKTDNNICTKCKKEKTQIVNRDKILCLNCFEEIITHKFRSNLRTNCKIRHEDFVLVCISGGNSSMCMLNLFYKTFHETTTNRKLFFKLKVVFIDDSLFLIEKDKIINERNNNKHFLKTLCKKYHFDIDIINLENIFLINDPKSNLLNEDTNMDLVQKYLNLFNKIPSKGGFKSQFVKISIQNLIFAHSLRNSFTKIIYGTSGQGVVNDIFSQITIGKGANIQHSNSYLDNFYLAGKIQILKPLRDFFHKEILYYNHYNKIDILYSSFKSDQTDLIINSFFEGLQNTKISTVPSVINTTEKLVADAQNVDKCKFCQGKLDKPKTSLEFGISVQNDENKNNSLCYGCLRMFVNMNEEKEINEVINIFNTLSI